MKRLWLLTSMVAGSVAVAGFSPTAQGQASRSETRTINAPVHLSMETYQLENGLRVVLSRDPAVAVVAVNIWYHVGSANEEPGRTGFAHLFEHMMFKGSEDVDDGEHFRVIEEAGGTNNASTSSDRTNYFEAVPSNFLEPVLWLEADRMGYFLPALTQEKLDNQRSVVQNERRERYDNAPYGLTYETLERAIYPAGHPYAATPIGSMEDLNAASLDNVRSFFAKYYSPSNATLSIVGNFDPAQAKRWVERYFGPIPPAPTVVRPQPAAVQLSSEKRLVLEDRVQLPRLTIVWPSPIIFQPGDADLDILSQVLAGGRSSRLYQRLVYQEQIAQSVDASQYSRPLSGEFTVEVTARPGVELTRILKVVDEEIAKLRSAPPSEREVQAARNAFESGYIEAVQTTEDKADIFNMYATYTGDPASMERDFARYTTVTPASVQEAVRRYLGPGRVMLSVVPQGQTQLSVPPAP